MDEEKGRLSNKLKKLEVQENMLSLQYCLLNRKSNNLAPLALGLSNGIITMNSDSLLPESKLNSMKEPDTQNNITEYYIQNECKLLRENAKAKDIAIAKLESELNSLKDQNDDHSEKVSFDQKLKSTCEKLQKRNDELGLMDESKQLDLMVADNRCAKNEINDILFKT